MENHVVSAEKTASDLSSTSMVERVAYAMNRFSLDNSASDGSWFIYDHELNETVRIGIDASEEPLDIVDRMNAVAVIKAMREPTTDMVDEGDIYADGPGYSAKVWESMIDKSLSDFTRVVEQTGILKGDK